MKGANSIHALKWLLFKQHSNDMSDEEIRLQSLYGFSKIKSLIDGRKAEKKGFFSQYSQLTMGKSKYGHFEQRQTKQSVEFVLLPIGGTLFS